ncbi:hypothetical protein HJC23_000672 [Cyclotella cryptica]|uniref:DUF202 domain-containing protein n=1 Tax=Cyclotella cryptica TaxID=29204 RepID=A0ABD3Q8I9_9STRA|eukprot:CCRYP_008064-RA/>CCRYP_008064-RA protein AED:0.03 eAED:0.03 QI:97/1/1/1/0.66/0.5/4/2010/224
MVMDCVVLCVYGLTARRPPATDPCFQGCTMPVIGDGPTIYFNATVGVDQNPEAASFADFNPRPVSVDVQADAPFAASIDSTGWFTVLFGRKPTNAFAATSENTGTMVMNRTSPSVKVDPKVFFANERTFLAWLHVSVILAGASVAIVALSDTQTTTENQLYGVILLPISIAFIVYAMMQYSRRASMIRRQAPGPFVDVAGPTLLSISLIVALVAHFSIKLSTLL